MCDLCATDPLVKEAAHARAASIGRRLEDLAAAYHLLATGDIDPHSAPAKNVGRDARSIIRELVADWL